MAELTVFVDSADLLTRDGIELALAPFTDLAQVSRASSAEVVVVVVNQIDAAALQRLKLLRRNGAARLVVVVDRIAEAGLIAAVGAGVSGILPRGMVSGSALAGAVRAAAGGDGTLPPDLLGRLLTAVGRLNDDVLVPRGLTLAQLSDRETDVLRLVADGYDTAEIAEQLNYSPRTIKSVIHDVMRRHNLRNRTHAVAFAIRSDLI